MGGFSFGSLSSSSLLLLFTPRESVLCCVCVVVGMGQQVGRVGESASTTTGLHHQQHHHQQQPPPTTQPHAPQPHQGLKGKGSGGGRRPREVGGGGGCSIGGTTTTGTPPGRTAAVNVPDPGINIFTQHSGKRLHCSAGCGCGIVVTHECVYS